MQIRDRVSCFLRLQRQVGVGDGLPCKQAHAEAPVLPCLCAHAHTWMGGQVAPAALLLLGLSPGRAPVWTRPCCSWGEGAEEEAASSLPHT